MAEETNELVRADSHEVGSSDRFPITSRERREMAVNTGPHPEETEQIKARIEETRNQMGETIEALQEKLSFSNLSEQVSEHVSNAIETAKSTIYDATIGKATGFMKNMGDGITRSTVVRTARNNPLPLVLIGLGTGLLIYNGFSKTDRRRRSANLWERSSARTPPPEEVDRSFSSSRPVAEGLKDRVSTAATSAYEGVTNAVDTAYSGTRDLAARAYSRAGEYGSIAQETYDHYVEENPLAVGAAAFALGAVVGLAIPATRYEGELMGETRDELFRKARNTGSQLLDRTKQLVDEAAQSVSNESRPIIH